MDKETKQRLGEIRKAMKKYGFDKLSEIAKLNFKNTEKIKNIIDNL